MAIQSDKEYLSKLWPKMAAAGVDIKVMQFNACESVKHVHSIH